MSKALRIIVPGCIAFIVASCSDATLSPERERQSDVAAARAVEGGLSTWPVSASEIALSWVDNVRNETGWEIQRSTTGAAGAFTFLASVAANVTSYSHTGLAPSTEYCYKVRSFKKSGPNTSYGTLTAASCSTTFAPPAAPSDLAAVPASSNSVNVTWIDNANTELGIRLERAPDPAGPWEPAASLGQDAQSHHDFGRVAEQQVCYRAVAWNSQGGSPSNVDCTAPPVAPTNIAAAGGSSSIDVSWSDASNVNDGYEVQRALDDFNFVAIAQLAADATGYNDAAIATDTRYWYRVRAKKDGGFSEMSGWVSAAIASGPPRTPENVSAWPAGSTVAGVTWGSVSPSTTGLRIERSTDGQASWATAGTAGPSDGAFYDYERTTESQVCYRVYALNSFGESVASNVDCTVPPAAPTNLSATYQDDGSTLISWSDNSNVEEYVGIWTVYCYEGWYCEYYNFFVVEANATSVSVYLTWNEYVAEVYAYSDGGSSDAASWLGVAAASRASVAGARGERVTRPTKGARAPAPPLAARTKMLPNKLPPGRKLP